MRTDTLQNWVTGLNYSTPLAVLSVLLVIFSSYLTGYFVLERILSLKWRHRSLEQIAFLVTGLDIFMFLSLVAGYSLAVSKWAVWGGIFCGATGGIAVFFAKFMKMRKADFRVRISFFMLISAFSALTLGAALCFPIGWDELVYHTALPMRWLSDGLPFVYQDNPYSGFPSSPELLFRWLVHAGGIKAPRLLTWFVFIIVIYSLYLLLKPGFSGLRAFVLAFVFCFSPLTLMLSREAYVEIFILMNLAGALILAKGLRLISRRGTAYAAALGIFAGGAFSVKMTGGSVSVAIFILLFFMLRDKSFRKALPAVLIFLIFAAFFALPFYLRPYVATGNPFHPYFAWYFSPGPGVSEMSTYHHAIGNAKFGVEGICAFFSAPLLLSLCKIDTFDGSFGYQFIPVFILCLCSALAAFRGRGPYLKTLIFMMAALYIFWFFTSQQARFIYPFFFLALIVAAHSFRFSRGVNSFLIALILALGILSVPRPALSHYVKSWKTALGRARLMNYLYSGTGKGYLKAMSIISDKTPPDSVILLLFEKRGLYVPRKYLLGTPFFQEKFFMPFGEKGPESQACIKQLREEGVTHVLAGNPEKDPDRLAAYLAKNILLREKIGDFVSSGLFRPIGEAEGYCIYELHFEGAQK